MFIFIHTWNSANVDTHENSFFSITEKQYNGSEVCVLHRKSSTLSLGDFEIISTEFLHVGKKRVRQICLIHFEYSFLAILNLF